MKIQTLIEAGKTWYRAAVLEDGAAVSFTMLPKTGDETGPLYLARVKTVDRKINAAFLDLGEGGEAFLPYRQAKGLKTKLAANISGLLEEGELILVKITAPSTEHGKLPLATANPMIAGRYALSGHLKGKGLVARSITAEEERKTLETILAETHGGQSLIIRSAATGVEGNWVKSEIEKQQALWKTLEKKKTKPGVVLPAPGPLEQILRDDVPAAVDEILIDDKVAFLNAQKLADEKWPDLRGKVSHFPDGAIIEAHGVEERLDWVREGRVPLPSGGVITIEDTRAMTVIDVNSGAGRKGTTPSALHLAANLEAARAITREVRFQNLSGLITVDFIDMREEAGRDQVVQALQKGLEADRMATELTGINRFGLLTIKRARRGEALKTLLQRVEKP